MTKKNVLGLVSALALVCSPAMAAIRTTSLQVPLNITIHFDPADEDVLLTGRLHVVTQVQQPTDPCMPTDPCRVPITIHANLDGVTGIGQSTGNLYRATGEFVLSDLFDIPGSSTFTAQFDMHSRLYPTDPCFLDIQVFFDGLGNLTDVVPGGE